MKTIYTEDAYLMHYGIKGQKKGRRRFQNEDGSLTPAGERRYLKGDDGVADRAAAAYKTAQSISSSTEERVNRIKSAVARANDSYKSAQASAKLVADRAAAAYKTAQASKQLAADREAYRQNMIAAKKQRDEYAQRNTEWSVANYRKYAADKTTYGTSRRTMSDDGVSHYGRLSDSQRKAIERQQTKKDVRDKVNNFINNTTTSAKNNAVNAVKNTADKSAQASEPLDTYRKNMIAAKKQRDEYAQLHAKESVANYRKNAAANTMYGTSWRRMSDDGVNHYGRLSDSQRKAIERQQTKKDVRDKVNNFINNTTTSAKNTASNVANGISEAKDNAVNAVKNTADNISNKISETKTNISNKISETKTNITNKISDKISSLKKEAEKAFNKATDKAMEKIYEAVESGAEFAYDSLNEIESRFSGSNGFEISVNSGGSKITISVDDTDDIAQQGMDFVNSLFGKR